MTIIIVPIQSIKIGMATQALSRTNITVASIQVSSDGIVSDPFDGAAIWNLQDFSKPSYSNPRGIAITFHFQAANIGKIEATPIYLTGIVYEGF